MYNNQPISDINTTYTTIHTSGQSGREKERERVGDAVKKEKRENEKYHPFKPPSTYVAGEYPYT